jgi:polysaccharide deacetylase 2 family uncharacterized protein YibQ
MQRKRRVGIHQGEHEHTGGQRARNAVSNMIIANPLEPKQRTSQRVADTISMKANRDTKVRITMSWISMPMTMLSNTGNDVCKWTAVA